MNGIVVVLFKMKPVISFKGEAVSFVLKQNLRCVSIVAEAPST